MNPALENFLKQAEVDQDILGVILFGSRARGEETPGSDFDVCLVLAHGRDSREAQVNARLKHLPSQDLDIRIFQQLPLYIRRRVLREGVVLYCRDLDQLYALAYRTAQALEDFKPRYRQYLEQIVNAGP